MKINIITKILGKSLPYDIIREISTYFIQKISKQDERYGIIEYFLYKKKLYLSQGFYPDGEFCYNLVCFNDTLKKYLLLRVFPKLFIEYHFCIDNRISSIRFWIIDNKCQIAIDDYWVEKNDFTMKN